MTERYQDKNILVIGDVMLDRYIFGGVSRISPEAPIPVFKEKGESRVSPGGAANVAVNLSAIGIKTSLCAVVGNDPDGSELKKLLEENKVDVSFIYEDRERVTTRKLRYMGPNNQQMLRVDSEDDTAIPTKDSKALLTLLSDRIDQFDLILISDYAKGVMTDGLTQGVISLAKKKEIPVFVDVKGKSLLKYKGATLLKPNRKELHDLTGMSVDTKDDVLTAALSLCRGAECRYVLATLGADGMMLVDKNGLIRCINSVANEIFDVTGAGDTSVAYLSAEYVMGESIEMAMKVSNVAAGIQVSRVGTCVIDPHDVYAMMHKMDIDEECAGTDVKKILMDINKCRSLGEKIVFTNGCFDILHAGHVTYLNASRKLGDILVVGVNDDGSVKRLKGDARPINIINDRIAVLKALKAVDFVIPFSEDTPLELIKKIKPDVLVKGGDYKPDEIIGSDFVKEYGGSVEVIPFVEGKSTTATIDRINGNLK